MADISQIKLPDGVTYNIKDPSALHAHQSVTDGDPTLSWGTRSKIATIGSTDIHVTMPSNPNTNTTYTFAEGSTNGAFSVTPSGGSASSVKIHGLGTMAYAATSSYVAKAGDTMTGQLDIRGTAATKPLKTRGIVGSNGSGTDGELYLQFGNSTNDLIVFGNSGGGIITSNGELYSGWSGGLQVSRVAKSCNSIPGINKMRIEEYSGGSNYNLPSNAFWHIYTSEGSDNRYACQLALGMTADGAYVRRYSNSSWGGWKSLNGTSSADAVVSAGTNISVSATVVAGTDTTPSTTTYKVSHTGTTTTTPAGAALAKYGNVVWLPIWGVAGNNIGTIPSAYRPKVPCRNLVYCIDTNGRTYAGVAEVNTSGVFNCWYYTSYGSGTSTSGNNANTKVYGEMMWITA